MGKRGQVTLFIILGIVLLASIVAIIVLTSRSSTDDLAARALAESVPAELLPFKEYVEQCTDTLLWDAVQRAGMQGGIIYPEELNLQFNYYSQTEADGLMIFENSDFVIPYWVYMDGDNKCNNYCTKVAAPPPLESGAPASIKVQIETYIERNFNKCLADSSKISPLGVEFSSLSDPVADIEFSESDVRLVLDNLFEVDSSGEDSQIRYFMSTVPIPFRQYYNDAIFLAAVADQTNFLERGTLSWISAYSGMDSKRLPPKVGSDSDFVSTNYWATQEVRQKLTQLLQKSMPLFTLTTSKNFHPITEFQDDSFYDVKMAYYDDFIMESPSEFSKYSVDFSYSGWSSYISLNGGKEVISPQSGSVDWFPWIGVNRVSTMYDVSYPVLITLHDSDDTQPDGKGFTFNFAVEVNIRNNAPMDDGYEPVDYAALESSFPTGNSMFCDIDQRVSEPLALRVLNGKTYEPEPGVALTLVCGKESCPVGMTDENGIFNESVPICTGGRLQLLKPDFETIFLRTSPNMFDSINLGDIPYEPYRVLNLSAEKVRVGRTAYDKNSGSTWSLISTQRLKMNKDETAIIQLERIDPPTDFIIKEPYSTVGVIEDGVASPMTLLPGTYVGQIVFIRDQEVIIPARERCFDGGMFSSDECVMIPEEDIVLDKYSGGGAFFTNSTMPLTIKKSDIDNNGEIQFTIIYADLPSLPEFTRYVEDLEVLGKIEEYSATHRGMIDPTFE